MSQIAFNLTDAESYKAYFAAVAASNKLVDNYLHGQIEVAQEEASVWQGTYLWAWPAERANGSGQNDNYFFTREGTIWIGGPCASELHADQDTFYFNMEKIAKQVVSKLIRDFTQAGIVTNFLSYKLQRADMKLSATDMIGCELTFTFADPDDLEYNENDWQ